MNMIKSRALTSHTCKQETANTVADDVLKRYYPAFVALQQLLNAQHEAC